MKRSEIEARMDKLIGPAQKPMNHRQLLMAILEELRAIRAALKAL